MIFNSATNGGGMTLLWENQDPNLGFSEQTIPCDTSGYNAFFLVMRSERNYENYYAGIISNIKNIPITVFGTVNLRQYYRTAKVTASGIWFENYGHEDQGSGNISNSVNTAYPIKVYGIR